MERSEGIQTRHPPFLKQASAPRYEPSRIEDASPPKDARREVFALDEGDVVLTFPDNLSAASYDDLESHLQLFLRKAKRRALGEAAH